MCPHCSMAILSSIGQNVQPFSGNGDVFIMSGFRVGRKTTNNQTKQTDRYINRNILVYTLLSFSTSTMSYKDPLSAMAYFIGVYIHFWTNMINKFKTVLNEMFYCE